MDEFTQPPAIVRPAVSNEERVVQLIQEAKALDGMMKSGIRITADQMVSRGNALIKAAQLAGKGKWKESLAKNWPEMNERTARRYMALSNEKARADMVATWQGHTHKQLDDKSEDEESGEEKKPPLTVEQRKRLISLIGTVKPALAKKLREGTKKLTDAELEAEVPPSCDKCRRLGPPFGKPCQACEKVRKNVQGDLFEGNQEPEDEDDAGSAPAKVDPYAEARKFVAKTAATITKTAANDKTLYDALVACRLMDHRTGETPRFCALSGVSKVIGMVADGETDLAKIKRAYDIASGAFVPPMFDKGK